MKKTIPAISIIIPMYNSEKYIGECLDSIFAQTFQDFEVIVVDDCSTDSSCAIVENYIKTHRGGVEKLKLIRSKVNSGTPNLPRNTAIGLSRGEYLMFVDADDAITSTALEEIYPLAKKFDADVVHCERHFISEGETITTNKNRLKISAIVQTDFVTKPSLMTMDLLERMKIFVAFKLGWTTYTNFVRRDFVLKNRIQFPNLKMGGDMIFHTKLLCFARNFVIVPNVYYIYRQLRESVSRFDTNSSVTAIIERGGALTFKGIQILDKFLDEFDVFRNNPEYRYALFEHITSPSTLIADRLYSQIPAYKLDSLVRKELDGSQNLVALTAFLFAKVNIFKVQLGQYGAIIQQMNAYIQQQQAKINELQRQLENRL